MSKKLTTTEFIERARKVHGNKYDYSKVNYVNGQTKVCIVCPKHVEFWKIPNSHLNGFGCFKCGRDITSKKRTLTTNEFVKRVLTCHAYRFSGVTNFSSSKSRTA